MLKMLLTLAFLTIICTCSGSVFKPVEPKSQIGGFTDPWKLDFVLKTKKIFQISWKGVTFESALKQVQDERMASWSKGAEHCCQTRKFFITEEYLTDTKTNKQLHLVQLGHLNPPKYQNVQIGLCKNKGKCLNGGQCSEETIVHYVFVHTDNGAGYEFAPIHLPGYCTCKNTYD